MPVRLAIETGGSLAIPTITHDDLPAHGVSHQAPHAASRAADDAVRIPHRNRTIASQNCQLITPANPSQQNIFLMKKINQQNQLITEKTNNQLKNQS